MKKNTYMIFTIKRNNKFYSYNYVHHNNCDLLGALPKEIYNVTITDTKKESIELAILWNNIYYENGTNLY